MSDAGHDLHSLFPQDGAILTMLKTSDSRFAGLAARYHEVAKAIHLIEADVEPTSDERLEALKKDRLALLDDVAAMVAAARVGAG